LKRKQCKNDKRKKRKVKGEIRLCTSAWVMPIECSVETVAGGKEVKPGFPSFPNHVVTKSHVFLNHVVAPHWIAPRYFARPITSVISHSTIPAPPLSSIDILPEDGDCNICRFIENPSIIDAASSPKAEVIH
jgi:hypothetical protein